jgi:RNA polymerase sigma-70 factor (ECF subfamily)
VQQYQERVVNTCYGFLHNRQDAEDTAQEVFLEIFRSIRSFQETSRLGTWIYRISITKSIDHLRKMKRKKRMAALVSFFGTGKEDIAEPAGSEDPHSLMEEKERALILKNAVDTLAENQRIALTLHRYQGFKYEEIAEIMGISLSAVESLMHRAKKNLQKILFNYYAKQQEI